MRMKAKIRSVNRNRAPLLSIAIALREGEVKVLAGIVHTYGNYPAPCKKNAGANKTVL